MAPAGIDRAGTDTRKTINMKYESIADIYSANQKIREGFTATLNQISPDEANALPDGEKWTIQQVAEHVSIVQVGISQICAKLVAEAKIAAGKSDGRFNLSDEFGGKLAEIHKGFRIVLMVMSNAKAEKTHLRRRAYKILNFRSVSSSYRMRGLLLPASPP